MAVCQTDFFTGLDKVGLSDDKKNITDSDAVRACEAIGGELPALDLFLSVSQELARLPQYAKFDGYDPGPMFWLSDYYLGGDGQYAVAFSFDNRVAPPNNVDTGWDGPGLENILNIVCIKHSSRDRSP